MMHTYLHIKETPTASWDVAHLYEHLFLQSFYRHVREQGIDPGTVGFILADTFENAIFIDAGFYSKQIADLYESFVTAGTLDMNLLDAAIAECEAEERVLFSAADKDILKQKIHELATMPWQNGDTVQSKKYEPSETKDADIIIKKKSAKSFRTVRVAAYLENPSLNEAMLWLRLSVIVNDIIITSMREEYNCYHTQVNPTSDREQYLVSVSEYHIRKGISARDITAHIQSVISHFDVDTQTPYITDHFNELTNQPLWKSLPVEYYRHAGYIANMHTIRELATTENIKSILGKLQVKVRADK